MKTVRTPMRTGCAAPDWFSHWWHTDVGLGRTASESYASMLSALRSASEAERLVCIPRAQHEALMTAAKVLFGLEDTEPTFGTSNWIPAQEALAALRAAGIQIEET